MRCEYILEDTQDEEIHLVGAVSVSRMTRWPNFRRTVVQDVVHEMRFMIVRTNDVGID